MRVLSITVLLLHMLTSPGNIMVPEIKEPYILREEIPILMYHEIGIPEGRWKQLYVEPEVFSEQLDWLKEHGYSTILLQDIYDHWINKKPLPEKPIVISLDDGYRSMYDNVLPLLLIKKMKATFFLYPSKFNTPNGLTPDMVASLAHNGMEIGSHTYTHKDLTMMPDNRLKQELLDCKLLLEKITQKPVTFLSYPAGRFNQKVIKAAKKYGYKGAVITRYGISTMDQDLFKLKRIRIDHSDEVEGFIKKIEAFESGCRSVGESS